MEIFTLLETLEDMLENSKKMPFTNKGMVDKEEMLDIIKDFLFTISLIVNVITVNKLLIIYHLPFL